MRLERRILRDKQNPFEIPDDHFVKLFRLSKNLVVQIIHDIEGHVHHTRRITAVPFHLKVLATLNFLGQGSFQCAVGLSTWNCMSQPMISRSIAEVCYLITQHLMDKWVIFPTTNDLKNSIKGKFYQKSGLRGIIGAIDGTHVEIIAPPRTDVDHPPFVYLNRKGKYSVNVMLISDADCKILAVDARYPGSVHDAAIFRMSNIRNYLRTAYGEGVRDSYLIGDSGYGVEPWLLKPFLNVQPDSPEERFNQLLTSARNVIERTNGIFKRRFACLSQHRVLIYHPSKAAYIIYACAVCHNMALSENLQLDDENENLEDIQNELLNPPYIVPEEIEFDEITNLGRQVRNQYIIDNRI